MWLCVHAVMQLCGSMALWLSGYVAMSLNNSMNCLINTIIKQLLPLWANALRDLLINISNEPNNVIH